MKVTLFFLVERDGSDMEAEAIEMNEIDCDKRKERGRKGEEDREGVEVTK